MEFKSNDIIGVQKFYQELKNIGALDKYLANYMESHSVSSPLRITEVMRMEMTEAIDGGYFYNAYSHFVQKENRTPIETFLMLCHNFSSYSITFPWTDSDEGYDFWQDVRMALEHTAIKIERGDFV